jgi:hypothetical protein
MFDFEKLEVYQLVKEQTSRIFNFALEIEDADPILIDQLKNSMLQGLTSLVHASGRISNIEKQALLADSRCSVFVSATILDLLHYSGNVSKEKYQELYDNFEKISKMLLGMFRSYNAKVEEEKRSLAE